MRVQNTNIEPLTGFVFIGSFQSPGRCLRHRTGGYKHRTPNGVRDNSAFRIKSR